MSLKYEPSSERTGGDCPVGQDRGRGGALEGGEQLGLGGRAAPARLRGPLPSEEGTN